MSILAQIRDIQQGGGIYATPLDIGAERLNTTPAKSRIVFDEKCKVVSFSIHNTSCYHILKIIKDRNGKFVRDLLPGETAGFQLDGWQYYRISMDYQFEAEPNAPPNAIPSGFIQYHHIVDRINNNENVGICK